MKVTYRCQRCREVVEATEADVDEAVASAPSKGFTFEGERFTLTKRGLFAAYGRDTCPSCESVAHA